MTSACVIIQDVKQELARLHGSVDVLDQDASRSPYDNIPVRPDKIRDLLRNVTRIIKAVDHVRFQAVFDLLHAVDVSQSDAYDSPRLDVRRINRLVEMIGSMDDVLPEQRSAFRESSKSRWSKLYFEERERSKDKDGEIRELEARLRQREGHIEDLNSEIRRRESARNSRDHFDLPLTDYNTIRDLERELNSARSRISLLEQQIRRQKEKSDRLKDQLEKQEQESADLKNELMTSEQLQQQYLTSNAILNQTIEELRQQLNAMRSNGNGNRDSWSTNGNAGFATYGIHTTFQPGLNHTNVLLHQLRTQNRVLLSNFHRHIEGKLQERLCADLPKNEETWRLVQRKLIFWFWEFEKKLNPVTADGQVVPVRRENFVPRPRVKYGREHKIEFPTEEIDFDADYSRWRRG